MRAWINHAKVRSFITAPLTRTIVLAIGLMTGIPLVATLLLTSVPAPVDVVVQTSLVVLLISLVCWPMSIGRRLGLFLLIGGTVWSVGMLTRIVWSLMECMR